MPNCIPTFRKRMPSSSASVKIPSHRKFTDKYGLPFILLADPDTTVLQQYGVWQEKQMYGRSYMGVVRTTYLIDENGVIVKVMAKVNASSNPADMLALL